MRRGQGLPTIVPMRSTLRRLRPRLFSIVLVFGLLVACSKRSATPPAPTPCATDGDCVLSCAGLGDCCPMPCGCTIPMHKADKASADEANRALCTDAERAKCPTVGGCGPAGPPLLLRCAAGKCVAEKAAVPPAG